MAPDCSFRYSHSRLSVFETCPLQYKFIYLDRIFREEQSIEAFLGSCFHRVMEKLYRELPYRLLPVEELLAFYDELWEKGFNAKVVIVNQERTVDEYRRAGRGFIEAYYRHYHPFNQARVLGVERQVEIDLDGTGRYRLIGYVDRIDLGSDGVYEIHDYKTSNYLPEQKEVDTDRQLALYQIGLQQMWPEAKKVRLVWHYVAFGVELSSTRTPEELEIVREETIKLIKKIEQETEFPPQESALCAWCVYQDLCPLKKHQLHVAPLPVNEFLEEPGVKLVNLYAELWRQKKEIDSIK